VPQSSGQVTTIRFISSLGLAVERKRVPKVTDKISKDKAQK